MRAVRLVASVAGEAGGMFGRHNLRKSLGLGGIFFVAATAKRGNIGQDRFNAYRILRMLRLRAVTGFACNVSMLAGGASLGFVVMAGNTSGLAGESQRALADQLQRGRAIVAVLAEGFRNYGAPNNQKNSQPGEQDCRRADEMSGIPKEPHRRLAQG
jgi:hypothetical protein